MRAVTKRGEAAAPPPPPKAKFNAAEDEREAPPKAKFNAAEDGPRHSRGRAAQAAEDERGEGAGCVGRADGGVAALTTKPVSPDGNAV